MVHNTDLNQYNIDQNTANIDYYITNFRGYQSDLYLKARLGLHPFDNELYSINFGKMKILGVYKLKD